MEKRICKYRNCGNIIPETTRSHANYCNLKCRDKERTYIKRARRKSDAEKETIKEILNIFSSKSDDEIELLKKLLKSK